MTDLHIQILNAIGLKDVAINGFEIVAVQILNAIGLKDVAINGFEIVAVNTNQDLFGSDYTTVEIKARRFVLDATGRKIIDGEYDDGTIKFRAEDVKIFINTSVFVQ